MGSMILQRRQTGRKSGEAGFTLIELMAVMVIMAIMMTLAVVAWIDIGRGAAMRSAVLDVQSGLEASRQYAVTRRVHTTFSYFNTGNPERGTFTARTNGVLVGMTNYLENGVVFTNPSSGTLVYKFDGRCSGIEPRNITIVERDRGENSFTNVLTVFPLTGRCKVLSN
jgi:prepilin-type N-terminal cleavage/methylation domain-containing protein